MGTRSSFQDGTWPASLNSLPMSSSGCGSWLQKFVPGCQASSGPTGSLLGSTMAVLRGKTIAHGHVHVIPRRVGDVPDLRGGLLWVIPQKAPLLDSVGHLPGTVSPERPVRFLQQIPRLLGEGSFVASYKFALLHALADLCIIHGDNTDIPLRLETRAISEAMIELYWRQTVPFPSPSGQRPQVLRQCSGRQAGIISRLSNVREQHGRSLQQLKKDRRVWNRLVGAQSPNQLPRDPLQTTPRRGRRSTWERIRSL